MPQDTARYWNMLEDLDAVQDAMSATEAAFVEDLLTRREGGMYDADQEAKGGDCADGRQILRRKIVTARRRPSLPPGEGHDIRNVSAPSSGRLDAFWGILSGMSERTVWTH